VTILTMANWLIVAVSLLTLCVPDIAYSLLNGSAESSCSWRKENSLTGCIVSDRGPAKTLTSKRCKVKLRLCYSTRVG
jgi:hypothetical protein